MRRAYLALVVGFLGLLLLLCLSACSSNVPLETTGPPPTPVHTDLDRPTGSSPRATPQPTVTPQPSAAAQPTPTATATPTAPATAPPTSSATPAPTTQPTPTPTPEPTGPPPSPQPIAADQRPCPKDIAAGWTCVRLTVPLDHFHEIGRTTHVTFALKRHTAKGPAQGTWVTITGGPGTAGIYSAVSYTDSFDPQIRKHYDLAFMDQRGAGMSDSFTCPRPRRPVAAT